MDSDSSKKVVLITGCSEHSIGDALAREFLQRGLHVIATGRSLDRVQHLKDVGCQTAVLDVTSVESISKLSTQIDRVHILVNNAGMGKVCTISDTSIADFRLVFDTNFFGPVELTKAFLPQLIRAEGGGIVVNHTSTAVFARTPINGAYAASKAALASITDTMRLELAPFGIRVVQLVTGMAMSNIMSQIQGTTLPPGSLYLPARETLEKIMSGEAFEGKIMAGDVYAKKVVGDLLRSRGPPVWIWRGSFASMVYWTWLLGCHWKGLFDSVISRVSGMHVLRDKLQKQSAQKLE